MALLNDPLDEDQVQQIRTCVNRGRPLGKESWVGKMAERLGLQFTLRNAGRPKKGDNQ
jgi:hypothetical protein